MDGSIRHIRRFSPATETRTLYHFDEPVSPHLAVQRSASKAFPTDQEFRANVTRTADEFSRSIHGGQRGTMIIESAGGEPSRARVRSDWLLTRVVPTALSCSPASRCACCLLREQQPRSSLAGTVVHLSARFVPTPVPARDTCRLT